MAAGDQVVSDWQVEWNAYLFGADQPVGVSMLEGVESLPDLRLSDVPRSRAHGSLPGPLTSRERLVTMTGDIVQGGEASMRAVLDAVHAALAVSDTPAPLVFRAGHSAKRRVNARVLRRSIPSTQALSMGLGEVVAQWVCADPRVYGDTLREGSTGVGSVSGGLGFPHGFPHGFGTATAGTIATTNDGNETAPWIGTLTGPLTSPRIYLPAGGGNLEMIGFSLGSGETLVFDSLERTVLLNGTASRYGSLTSRQWFHIPVGSSTVALGAASGAGTLDLEYRDTWL